MQFLKPQARTSYMNSIPFDELKNKYNCVNFLLPLEFHFSASEDRESVHVVDLLDNEMRGSCTCQQWDFRIRPKVGVSIDPNDEEYMCKHIRRARYLASVLLSIELSK